ncbi:MAG: hypothetical protein U9N77_11540, partial [Thermodesulfobacteriota bacterium]|nr:hypothetical protein [Thermodesulfobacteriota bacterium]
MKMNKIIFYLVIIMCTTSIFYSKAEPLPQNKVPDSLKPWIDWVLHGEEEQDCPLIYKWPGSSRQAKKICSWPSELKLDFSEKSALFSQKWEVYSKDIWLKLPGNNKFWPDKVKVNDQEWLVGARDGVPAIFMKKPGQYNITGMFYFDTCPEWILIPARSGLINLSVQGEKIAFPSLDKNGRLWLRHDQDAPDAKKRENHCKVEVHRLIKDSIPLEVITCLDLYISGKHRTIPIGKIGIKHFVPVKIESRLPVRIEQNGILTIQAKPGKWRIKVVLRHKGAVKSLSPALMGYFNTDSLYEDSLYENTGQTQQDFRALSQAGRYPTKAARGSYKAEDRIDSDGDKNRDKEIWSFEPHNHLRIVEIKGPSQIDPQQTTMPEEWKSFPAYLMLPDDIMKFEEKKRGDPHPAPDSLNLKRILWLDFDGNGYSVKDSISGKMTTGWRMMINPPVKPGRISLNGKEQFITSLDDSGRAGIEMRYGNVNITAESRIDKSGRIPVTGWDRDFHSVKGEIHLPPGWSIFDTSGIDNIRATWLKSWTLFDLFLVLIISLGVARLRAWKWGFVSLIVLVLIQHESGAPCWVWLHILAALALLKVLPNGKIFSLVNNYRLVSLACLIVISLPFMVNQIKHGIYPQLEYSWHAMDRGLRQHAKTTGVSEVPSVVRSQRQFQDNLAAGGDMEKTKPEMFYKKSKGNIQKADNKMYYPGRLQSKTIQMAVNEFDSNAKIQTGAGMPTWNWQKIKFSWNGPVKKNETMKFVFLSPKINMVLGFIQVILLGLLIYGIAGVKFSKEKGLGFSNIKHGALDIIVLTIVCMFSAIPANAESSLLQEIPSDKALNNPMLSVSANNVLPSEKALNNYRLSVPVNNVLPSKNLLNNPMLSVPANNVLPSKKLLNNHTFSILVDNGFPSEELLGQLKKRLTEKKEPDCAPNCAVSPRMKIVIDKHTLKITMKVHSLYKSLAVPLPGKVKHWLPETVLLNGKPASSLYRDPATGYFWVGVSKGIHTINLAGRLPFRNSVQIPFPLKPNAVDITADGWNVDGLHENGVIDDQLQFTKISIKKNNTETFEAGLLPQFVEIVRTFHLGLTWQIETIVQRKTPVGAAVVLQIPLLKGESVTSDIPVKKGKILLNLGPEQTVAKFVSSLAKEDQLILKAADTLDWTEIWKINVGTMWHSDIKGIPVIHHQSQNGRWFPEFRPWPGEEIVINISHPKGIKGQTHTIENSILRLNPGKRITNATLELNIRSSRGSRHAITLPSDSRLQNLIINNKSQPLSQDGDKVILPLSPGTQNIRLSWQTSNNINWNFKTPQVDIGMSSVDSHVFVKMPQNRWILFCAGPYVGPAVLFWSSVLVVLFLSFGLGRLKITPLKSYHWFLLGLGLTQASLLSTLPVAAWLIALGLRMKNGKQLSDAAFNFVQIILPALTLLAVATLFYGIQNGLLGYPDMQIAGNGSYNHLLKWYQDISGNILPQPVVFSLPMTVYRVLILAWALWIAFALIKWLHWGWDCYSADGLWRSVEFKRFKKLKKQ